MTGYLRVRNWEKFQAYKDGRTPTWIKLYCELADREEFGRLPDHTKAHLVGCWMLAARLDNRLTADAEWLGRRLNATAYVDLAALVGPRPGEGWLEDHATTPGTVAAILAGCPVRGNEKTVPRGEERRVEEIPAATQQAVLVVSENSKKPTAVPSKQYQAFNGIVAEACDDWTARFNAPAPGGKLAAAFGGLFKRTRTRPAMFTEHAWAPRVRPSWKRYLRDTEGRFADPHRFVATFGEWDVGPEKAPEPARDASWPVDDPQAVQAWDRVLEALQGRIKPHLFATWFRATVGTALEGRQLVIRVANDHIRNWIVGNYTDAIVAAQREAGTNYALTFEFEPPAAARAAS